MKKILFLFINFLIISQVNAGLKYLTVSEFRKLVKEKESPFIRKELEDYPFHKKTVGKITAKMNSRKAVNSTTVTKGRYIKNQYILFEIVIDDKFTTYNLIDWDEDNKQYISWSISAFDLQNRKDHELINKAVGKKVEKGVYKFESVLNPTVKEKVTINYDGKTYKYKAETSYYTNDRISQFLVVEGEEKPVENDENLKPKKVLAGPFCTINLQSGKSGEAKCFLNEKEIDIGELADQLKKLDKETTVLIRADKDVLFEVESKVIQAIKDSGLTKIRIQAELE